MFPLQTEVKLLIAAGIFAGGFFLGSAWKEAAWNKEKLATAAEMAELVDWNNKRINELEIDHAKSQTEIDRLHTNNHALWLRLPKIPCSGVAASSVGSSETATDKPLPVSPQEAINGYTNGVGELMYEADTVVNNCTALQQWAQGLNKKKD